MHHREWTRLGLATYENAGFRTYSEEWVDNGHGELLLLQPCEELVDGHWEGFVSELARRPRPCPN
jgi:hypothetical protein